MPTVHSEVEAKYEVDDAVELPGLVELLGAAHSPDGESTNGDGPWAEGEASEQDLSATYFDTPDLRLAVAGLTLRRRTGGADQGWHLKVPIADGSRSEVRLPLEDGESTVPDRLRTMTRARAGESELVPVARVDTHRSVRRLVDPTGRVLLELADDRVTARRLHTSGGADQPVDAASTWREIEVELVDGGRELLAAVDPLLRDRGLRPARTASKLVRTLGQDAVDAAGKDVAGSRRRRCSPSRSKASAADAVLAYLAAQVEQIRAQDLPVRLDVDGSVHAMRVATRRARSALKTFGPLLRRSVTRRVAAELKWLARVLGEARDAEVVRDRVTAAVTEETEHVTSSGAVVDDVGGRLDDAYGTAHDALVAHLDSDRYRALLGALTELLDHPPLKKRAGRRARRVLPELVVAADDEVRSAMRAVRRAGDPARQAALLHDARKAAKRARYAAEAVAPVAGAGASHFAAAMETVQEAVGEHLDALSTRARLRGLAEHTAAPGTAFTLGRLHAREDVHAARSRADVDAAWTRARKKRLRRWLC